MSLIVERRADQVLAIVEDNGRGFDVEAVMGAGCRGEAGPAGDAGAHGAGGGTLEVESRPGGGTSLFIHIPLRDEREAADHG